jgi:hypothetical protein
MVGHSKRKQHNKATSNNISSTNREPQTGMQHACRASEVSATQEQPLPKQKKNNTTVADMEDSEGNHNGEASEEDKEKELGNVGRQMQGYG